jgi:hypothetical protein
MNQVPAPGSSGDDRRAFELMQITWAAYLNLPPDDPYVVNTAHIYGLYDRILHMVASRPTQEISANPPILPEVLNQIEHRLDRIEKKLGSAPLQIGGQVGGRYKSWAEFEKHMALTLHAIALLIRMTEDKNKAQFTPVVPNSSEPVEGQYLKSAVRSIKKKPPMAKDSGIFWKIFAPLALLAVCSSIYFGLQHRQSPDPAVNSTVQKSPKPSVAKR